MYKICQGESIQPVLDHIDRELSQDKHIVLLYGDLGAGKTHLVKAFVNAKLGTEADSPTFSLVNSYEKAGEVIHHFDLYRVESAEEVEDIGLWDYIDQAVPCFIEWPEKIAQLLPPESILQLKIQLTLDQCREYLFS